MRRILDAHNGVVSEFHFNPAEERFAIRHVQDVDPLLEHNARLRAEGTGFSESRELRRVASIPLVLYHRWLKQGFDALQPDNLPELKRRLRGEYAYLRTSDGGF
ncbi:hypothetical protein GC177_05330 [bacterium]|nr:hypothetical protein [bacterium]